MKKNSLNKQLIKAISLGISASMALQPVTAFATEGDANTGDNTGDNVLEIENKTAEEVTIKTTEDAISEIQEKIETAEKETGLTFDNSYDEVVSITGETETAMEAANSAKTSVEGAKQFSENRDAALSEMNKSLDKNYDENINNSKTDFDDAAKTANEVEKLAITVTEDTSLEDAEKTVEDVNAKYEEVQEKLSKAEGEYAAAKDAYDKAFENYKKASEEGSKSFISINDAQRELEEAMKMLDAKKQAVEDQKTAAESYLKTVKDNDYQRIADSSDKLAKNETTSEEHAKLLIEAYVKANGGKDISFATEDKSFTAGLDENGEVKTEKETYNAVTYTDAEGHEVTELYTVAIDDNGEVSVSRVSVEEVENVDVTIKEEVKYSPAVEGKEEVLESWATEGGKVYEETQTSHKIVGEDGKFIAIDTEKSQNVSTEEDRNVKAPENTESTNKNGSVTTTTTTTYSENANSENKNYVEETYTVVDSYNTKTVTDYKSANSKDAVRNLISQYNDQKENVRATVSVGVLGLGFITYDVNLDNMNWGDKLNAWLGSFLGNGYNVAISYDVPDTTSPKDTHEEKAICEVVTKNYTETVTTVENGKEESGLYGWLSKDKKAAQRDMNSRKSELEAEGYTVKAEVKQDATWHYYYYVVKYSKSTTNTDSVTKEVSRTRYAADSYTEHTEYQAPVAAKEEVKAQPAVYGTKLETTTLGSFVENDLQTKLDNQKSAVENQAKAVKAAEDAEKAYNEAVKAVEAAKTKVEELKKTNTPVVTLAEASAELKIAMTKLGEATAKKDAADKAVANAKTAVNNASVVLTALQNKAKEKAEAEKRAREEAERNANQGTFVSTDDQSDASSEAATTLTNVVKKDKAVATSLTEKPEVLGAKRTSSKKATKTVAKSETKAVTKTDADTTAEVKETEKVETATQDVVVAEQTENTEVKDQVVIAEDQVALTDTIANTQNEKHFPWLVVAILAALGITTEEVVRRNSKKATEKNSSKKSK